MQRCILEARGISILLETFDESRALFVDRLEEEYPTCHVVHARCFVFETDRTCGPGVYSAAQDEDTIRLHGGHGRPTALRREQHNVANFQVLEFRHDPVRAVYVEAIRF